MSQATLRFVRDLVRLCVVVSVVLGSLAIAAPKKKKPVPKPAANIATEVALKKTLDGAEEKVGGCVFENAPAGPFTLVVKAQLALNSAGQLMRTTISFVPDGASAEKTRKCIDGVLQGLTWPKSNAPLINAEREWTFESR